MRFMKWRAISARLYMASIMPPTMRGSGDAGAVHVGATMPEGLPAGRR